MNNYHLYEEIGSGKFSVVYKGRKRHSIHYVAIKSVEKCRRAKVMTEVRMLSRLQKHPNVLPFYFWNETRNHLWVINAYCCGGDLMRLLKQDGKLDEEQSLLFARDICEGLFFVHTRGVIYTDLKPSNILFDDVGRLKLSDFGMAILLSDLGKDNGAPVPRRGTPYYMAPELFLEDGIHSFASDLWSLGIVLHEFVTGKPAFQPASFKELHNMILERQTPSLVPITSQLYEDCVHGLLTKDPTLRLDWNALHRHEVWRGKSLPSCGKADTDLPHQEHFRKWMKRNDLVNNSVRDVRDTGRICAPNVLSSPGSSTYLDSGVILASGPQGSGQQQSGSGGQSNGSDSRNSGGNVNSRGDSQQSSNVVSNGSRQISGNGGNPQRQGDGQLHGGLVLSHMSGQRQNANHGTNVGGHNGDSARDANSYGRDNGGPRDMPNMRGNEDRRMSDGRVNNNILASPPSNLVATGARDDSRSRAQKDRGADQMGGTGQNMRDDRNRDDRNRNESHDLATRYGGQQQQQQNNVSQRQQAGGSSSSARRMQGDNRNTPDINRNTPDINRNQHDGRSQTDNRGQTDHRGQSDNRMQSDNRNQQDNRMQSDSNRLQDDNRNQQDSRMQGDSRMQSDGRAQQDSRGPKDNRMQGDSRMQNDGRMQSDNRGQRQDERGQDDYYSSNRRDQYQNNNRPGTALPDEMRGRNDDPQNRTNDNQNRMADNQSRANDNNRGYDNRTSEMNRTDDSRTNDMNRANTNDAGVNDMNSRANNMKSRTDDSSRRIQDSGRRKDGRVVADHNIGSLANDSRHHSTASTTSGVTEPSGLTQASKESSHSNGNPGLFQKNKCLDPLRLSVTAQKNLLEEGGGGEGYVKGSSDGELAIDVNQALNFSECPQQFEGDIQKPLGGDGPAASSSSRRGGVMINGADDAYSNDKFDNNNGPSYSTRPMSGRGFLGNSSGKEQYERMMGNRNNNGIDDRMVDRKKNNDDRNSNFGDRKGMGGGDRNSGMQRDRNMDRNSEMQQGDRSSTIERNPGRSLGLDRHRGGDRTGNGNTLDINGNTLDRNGNEDRNANDRTMMDRHAEQNTMRKITIDMLHTGNIASSSSSSHRGGEEKLYDLIFNTKSAPQPISRLITNADLIQKCRSLLSHVETAVRPISNNTSIEPANETAPVVNENQLPFKPLALEDVFSCSNSDLETFLTKVYRCIAQGSMDTKITTLAYLEGLCSHMQVADLIINSSLLKLVLKMAKVKSSELRIRLYNLIGQLLRHATFLEPGIADLGIFTALTDAVLQKGESEKAIKRKAVAALGEVLFYVATQPNNGATQSKEKDDNEKPTWKVPSTTLKAMIKLTISQNEDEVVKHYAIKTLENIATQSPLVAQSWFLSDHGLALADALHANIIDSSHGESFRLTCLGALAMIARIDPSMATQALLRQRGDKSSYDLSCIVLALGGLSSDKQKAQSGVSAAFHLLLGALLNLPIGPSPELEQIAVELLELTIQPRGNSVFRGKAMVLLVLLAFVEVDYLLVALESHLGGHIERLSRENSTGVLKDRYVAQCVQMVTLLLQDFTPTYLGLLLSRIKMQHQNLVALPQELGPDGKIIFTVTGEQHYQYSLICERLARNLHFPVFLLSCNPLRQAVLNPRTLPLLTKLVHYSTLSQWRGSDVQKTTLLLCESVSAQVVILLESLSNTTIMDFLKALSSLLSTGQSAAATAAATQQSPEEKAAREEQVFLALRCFSDITVAILNDDRDTDRVVELLVSKFFPRVPVLFGCADPIPSVTMRLLSCTIEVEHPKLLRSVCALRHHILSCLSQNAINVFGISVISSMVRLSLISVVHFSEIYLRVSESLRAKESLRPDYMECVIVLMEQSIIACKKETRNASKNGGNSSGNEFPQGMGGVSDQFIVPQGMGAVFFPLVALFGHYAGETRTAERMLTVCEQLVMLPVSKGVPDALLAKTAARSILFLVQHRNPHDKVFAQRTLRLAQWLAEKSEAPNEIRTLLGNALNSAFRKR